MGFYAIQDYIAYIFILLAIIWFVSNFLFRRIEINKKFIVLILPYMLLGISIRILADLRLVERNQYWSITPGVYLLCILLCLVFIYIGLLIERFFKIEYWLFPFSLGFIISLLPIYLVLSKISDPERILYPTALAVFITAIIYLLSSLFRIEVFKELENLCIIFAHLLDSSATFVACNYFGFYEEHLLPRILISILGNSVVMIPLKLSLIILVLYLIEKWKREEKKQGKLCKILKLMIFILGIGPGIRNTLLPSLS